MPTVHGKNGKVYVGANQVGELRSFTIDSSARLAEDTAAGDDWATHKPGVNEANGTVEVWFDKADTNGQEALTVGSEATLNLYPGGNASGDRLYSCSALLEGVGVDMDMGSIVGRRFTWRANGVLTISTVT